MNDTDEPVAADATAAGAGAADEKPAARKRAAKKAPPRPAATSTLINKMLAILTRRLDLMMRGAMKAGEKEIQLMASMSKTLDQLVEMKKAEKASKAKPAQKRTTKELDELRKKIAERIAQLYRD